LANKKPQHFCWGFVLAEREGFEPSILSRRKIHLSACFIWIFSHKFSENKFSKKTRLYSAIYTPSGFFSSIFSAHKNGETLPHWWWQLSTVGRLHHARLDHYNRAVNLLEQQITRLKEYKASLINSAVTGKIKVPGVMEAHGKEEALA